MMSFAIDSGPKYLGFQFAALSRVRCADRSRHAAVALVRVPVDPIEGAEEERDCNAEDCAPHRGGLARAEEAVDEPGKADQGPCCCEQDHCRSASRGGGLTGGGLDRTCYRGNLGAHFA